MQVKYNINFTDLAEVLKLLRGIYPLVGSPMDCGEPMPTVTNLVLVDYVYKNPCNKKAFQTAWRALLQGSSADVYLAFHYFTDCLYFESRGLATFKIDRNQFIGLLRGAINRCQQELKGTITFVNGVKNNNPMKFIININEFFIRQYGFSLLNS